MKKNLLIQRKQQKSLKGQPETNVLTGILKENQELQKRVQKRMKNKLISVIISIFLLLPIGAVAVEKDVQYDSETQQAIEDVVNAQQLDEDESIVEEQQVSQVAESPYKKPISKKKIIKKFLLAMLGVLVSSLILYVGLTLYNRFHDGFIKRVKTPDGVSALIRQRSLFC